MKLLLKFASDNGFQLFLDVLLKFMPEKDRSDSIAISSKVVCARASAFSVISTFFESQETVNVLRLDFSQGAYVQK